MLRTIECSDFKSFVNFRLDFKPGLNILVGPNGSGKTNIILLLELLGSLTRSTLIEAISRAGGAGSIFRRKLDGTLSDLIDFTISGHGPTSTYRNEGTKNVKYKYSASIYLSTKENTIFFKNQHLQMSIFSQDIVVLENHPFDVSCDVRTSLGDDNVIITTSKIDYSNIDRAQIASSSREKLSPGQIEEAIAENCRGAAKDTYLFEIMERFLPRTNILIRDIRSARSFNITPSKARGAEDIGTPPVIEPDGSGLAATLHSSNGTRKRGKSVLQPQTRVRLLRRT